MTSPGSRDPRGARRPDDPRVDPRRRSPEPGPRRADPRPTGSAPLRRPPASPLVARRGPVAAPLRPAASRGGWFRRFVRRHGWRAYAIPVLAVATVLTLADVVTGGGTTAATRSSALDAPVSTAPGTPTTSSAPAEGEGAPSRTAAGTAAVSYVEQGAGTLAVVDGTSAVQGTGPLERFVVEVEDGIGVDGGQFAAAVEATLGDPRSWGSGGQLSFQRVGAAEAAAGDYDFRVSLVSPGSMETWCPGVGTGGYTSCRYGERAVINLARWETAVPDYDGDIATYRQYVVNHEVGHALGHGHEQCGGAGQLAPVMQQQTLGLQGCLKNAWPYPS